MEGRRKIVHHNQIKRYISPIHQEVEKLRSDPYVHQFRYLENEEVIPHYSNDFLHHISENQDSQEIETSHFNENETLQQAENLNAPLGEEVQLMESPEEPIRVQHEKGNEANRKSSRIRVPRTTYCAETGKTVFPENRLRIGRRNEYKKDGYEQNSITNHLLQSEDIVRPTVTPNFEIFWDFSHQESRKHRLTEEIANYWAAPNYQDSGHQEGRKHWPTAARKHFKNSRKKFKKSGKYFKKSRNFKTSENLQDPGHQESRKHRLTKARSAYNGSKSSINSGYQESRKHRLTEGIPTSDHELPNFVQIKVEETRKKIQKEEKKKKEDSSKKKEEPYPPPKPTVVEKTLSEINEEILAKIQKLKIDTQEVKNQKLNTGTPEAIPQELNIGTLQIQEITVKMEQPGPKRMRLVKKRYHLERIQY
jgi:hypothetical protein